VTDTVDEMKYYEDPAPAGTPTDEAGFDTAGKAAIAKVDAATASYAKLPTPKAGDSEGGKVKDFADWFSELQDKLAAAGSWTDDHEAAHKLLYRYAMWKMGQWGITVPANVEYMFRYLGKAENNQPVIARRNREIQKTGGVYMTETSRFFGSPNAANWCAPASSIPIWKVLQKQKMWLMDGGDPQGTWSVKVKIQVLGDALDGVEIAAGDYLRMVNHVGPLSGHIGTALKADPATGTSQQIWYVSGNAGKYGGGSVRIDSVKREKPPASYSYARVSGIGNRRDNLVGKQKKDEKDVQDVNAMPFSGDVSDLSEAQRIDAMRQKVADQAQGDVNADKAGIADADKKLAAEKALRPGQSGITWLTYVAKTSGMNLNDLKPSSDPSMKDWMTKWRAADHVVTEKKKQ